MMPNAWFHKLKVMSRASRKAQPTRTAGGPSTPKLPPLPPPARPPAEPPYLQPHRASYYFPSRQEKAAGGPGSPVHPRASDTLFPVEPPRKSKKKARRKQPRPSQKLMSSAGSWSCRATLGAVWEGDGAAPEPPPAPEGPPRRKEGHPDGDDGEVPCFDKLIIAEHYENCDSVAVWSRSCTCKVASPAHDFVIDMGSNSSSSTAKFEELDLPPILTKPAKKELVKPTTKSEDGARILSSKAKNCHKVGPFAPPRETQRHSQRRPSTPGAHGLRMRTGSPRLATNKKVRTHRGRKAAAAAAAVATPRKGLSESFAVVKKSSDPQRDFRDSMMEMIVENNIRASADLEDLLACYLSLNANEYHDVIVKVFEQIWLDLTDVECREQVHGLSRSRRSRLDPTVNPTRPISQ